ncbi:MAG TPA: glycosyltransferase family 4 protein, partial [Ardenticatenaceae bacterium]|nr:glycosyltransferase family 4 protein [Ardenticatenaceae bacterium]
EAPSTVQDGVRIVRFPVRHLPLSPLAFAAWRRLLWLLSAVRPVPVALLARLAHYTPWVPALSRWLEQTGERFDLVAGMTVAYEALLLAGLGFARRHGIPFVVYPLTHLGTGAQPGGDALARFYTMRHQVSLVQASHAVVAQTPTEARFYEARGVSPGRVVVAGPGVNPSALLGGDGQEFRRRHNLQGPLICSIAAMSAEKGSVALVEAVRRLWQAGRELELVLAGSILAPFQHFLAGLPSSDRGRVRLLGPIEEAEKRNLLAAADLFVMPSRTDSFGIVYLEAWLYRLPVIGAQTWGLGDVISHGHDGLLVPFGDVPALAEAIATLLDDPGRRAAMGASGEEKVYRAHTWEHKYTIVRNLYTRLTTGG